MCDGCVHTLRVARTFSLHFFLASRADTNTHGSRCLQCACHISPSHPLHSHVSSAVFALPARSLRHHVPVCTVFVEPFPSESAGQEHLRTCAGEFDYLANPTHLTNPKPVPPTGTTQNFPPLNQPLPAGFVDASASGSVHPFPAGRIDWLVAFLQQIMSPEDYQNTSFPSAPSLPNRSRSESAGQAQFRTTSEEFGYLTDPGGRWRHYLFDLW